MGNEFNYKNVLLSMHGSIESYNTEKNVKAAMIQYADSWNTGDIDKIKSLFSKNATFSNPMNANLMEGIDAIHSLWLAGNEMPGHIKTEVHETVICGDSGLLDFTINFHNPDNTVVALKVREFFSINTDGKIQSLEAYWDKHSIT